MQFKRFLILLLVVSVLVFGYYILRVNEYISGVYGLGATPAFWGFAAIAFGLLLVAHCLRAYKLKRLLLPVKDSGTRTQLQALLIGYLFNTLLPLRLGEIVRSYVLGRSLQLSASLMFALVMLERAIDGFILGLAGLGIAAMAAGLPSPVRIAIGVFSLTLVLIALVLSLVLVLLHRQDAKLLRSWHRFTALFNPRLQNSLRFKLWSVIYGLNKLCLRPALIQYAALSVAMWVGYIAAMAVLAGYFFAWDPASSALASFLAYLGVAIPSGPAYLGSYQAITDPVLRTLANGSSYLEWLVASWLMLAIPSSMVGAILLLRHRTRYERLLRAQGIDSLHDKLARREDLSQEFEPFLDSYFSNNTLSHILHRLETGENIKLIQYFKGGSDASTLLVHQHEEYVVKKIIPSQYANRLKAQHDWLKKHSHHTEVVRLKNAHETPSYFAIDIEYYPNFRPFFDYVHSQTLDSSRQIEDKVFKFLFTHVYELEQPQTSEQALVDYITSKITKKTDQAMKINTELAELRAFDTIVVNGIEYPNIKTVLERIKNNPRIWRDLSTYRESPVHGDVTIDNILASNDHRFKIIDPAPDQLEISGPVFDFGRHYQSLGYGYEFLCRDDSPVIARGNVITYEDNMSAVYSDLRRHFLEVIVPRWLTPEEQRAFKFHTAVNYSRVLAHRVHINPHNVAKFYAVSVRAFNDFLAQYDEPAPAADTSAPKPELAGVNG